ncbi:MAG: hypothetical protein ACREQ4_15210 [Candidatus Binataceae bacterium]
MAIEYHSQSVGRILASSTLRAIAEHTERLGVIRPAVTMVSGRLLDQRALLRWADDGGQWIDQNDTTVLKRSI